MARITDRKTEANRAAIYARVSDKSQDGEDKTSISEQTGDMEAYCESKGLTITARYQEVGRGWSKKRPEFQRMLADARRGRFDTIVCWKSDRLSRGMYPAAALMEVVEAHQIRLEAVLDAIDMKTFGLMAAIGKIELDNFRERSTMGKRGTAKQGRVPTGGVPYGYRIGDDGRFEVVEEQAEVVRRIFRMYVDEKMGSYSIAIRLTDEGVPTQTGKMLWLQSRVHHILRNATYTGTWVYGRYRHVSTEDGMKVYDQPKDTWIEIPVPQVVDDETWKRAQKLKKQRGTKAKRNTKVVYLLQHLLKCGECGRNFHARASWTTTSVRKGKAYTYDLSTPRRYYMCNGMQSMRLRCREKPYIRAEQLEEPIWREVKRVLQNPDLIVAGIADLDSQEGVGMEEEIAQAERDLRSIQMEEDRAIRLFVSEKITEAQLDLQRRFITERLESARAKLDDYLVQETSRAEKRRLMEEVLTWAREFGQGLDEVTPEERHDYLQMLVEEVIIDRDNNVDITLALPIDDDSSDPDSPDPESPQPECVSIGSQEPSRRRRPPAWGRSGSGRCTSLRPPGKRCRRCSRRTARSWLPGRSRACRIPRTSTARSAGRGFPLYRASAPSGRGPASLPARRRTDPSTPGRARLPPHAPGQGRCLPSPSFPRRRRRLRPRFSARSGAFPCTSACPCW